MQASVGFDYVLAFSNAVIRGHDHSDLRGQANGFVDVRIMIVSLEFGIVEGQRGYRSPQYIHGQGMLGSPPSVEMAAVVAAQP